MRLVFDDNRAFVGTQTVRGVYSLNAAMDELTGEAVATYADLEGNVLATIPSVTRSTRIAVERPL